MKIFTPALVVSLFLFFEGHSQDSPFVLVKKEDNVFIYERWIKFPKSNPPVDAREVKGEFHFSNSIAEAVRLLQDERRIQQWQSHVSKFEVFKTKDSTQWYEYSYHDIPWPVSDQDHLLHYQMTRNNSGEIFIIFESIRDEKLAPIKQGVTRMHLSGSWTFQAVNDGQVKATYRILSMPLAIPKFLTDPIIRNNMMTTIQEFIGLMSVRDDRSTGKK
jgi:hypothetical protein